MWGNLANLCTSFKPKCTLMGKNTPQQANIPVWGTFSFLTEVAQTCAEQLLGEVRICLVHGWETAGKCTLELNQLHLKGYWGVCMCVCVCQLQRITDGFKNYISAPCEISVLSFYQELHNGGLSGTCFLKARQQKWTLFLILLGSLAVIASSLPATAWSCPRCWTWICYCCTWIC